MRKTAFMVFATLGAFVSLALSSFWAADVARQHEAIAGSTVKLLLEGGHCSGVHLGGGIILSAAHCMGVKSAKTDLGTVMDAELLWQNTDYDIALMRVLKPARMATSELSCVLVPVGTNVVVVGSPLMLEFTRTKGTIITGIFSFSPWRELVAADVTAGPGNSGGGVFDVYGRVVGVLVGGATSVRMAVLVPSTVACGLLARA